ncbi:MAG: hypothetical protein ACREYF_08265 [Gammaproteobacteria bacterium]
MQTPAYILLGKGFGQLGWVRPWLNLSPLTSLKSNDPETDTMRRLSRLGNKNAREYMSRTMRIAGSHLTKKLAAAVGILAPLVAGDNPEHGEKGDLTGTDRFILAIANSGRFIAKSAGGTLGEGFGAVIGGAIGTPIVGAIGAGIGASYGSSVAGSIYGWVENQVLPPMLRCKRKNTMGGPP